MKENGSTFYARFPLGAACYLMFTPYLVNVKLVQGGARHIVQLEDISCNNPLLNMFIPYHINVKLVQGGVRHIVQLEDILQLYAQPG